MPARKMTIKIEALIMPNQGKEVKLDSDLLEDIRKNGLKNPLVVVQIYQSYIILEGFHRYVCLKALGYQEVSCLVYDLKLNSFSEK
jgi:ParB-like chromosome segregation protein Spo0J